MIQVQGISKRFGDTSAVQGLSFAAGDGTITGLLGANGAGKSTTMRMIAGVLTPDEGAISIGGSDPQRNVTAAQQQVGAVLDHIGLYARLTVRENLAYFARLRGLDRAELQHRVEGVLAELGLQKIADRATGGLSQGERMKVALGRVLIHRPTHLLLDEPTNGLDVPTVRALRQLLMGLRDAGVCILYSSHVLGEVESLCEQIVVINGGAVAGQGTRDELCQATLTATLEEAFVALTGANEEVSCTMY
jgi:sodium transport system ATP-binding protein